MPKRSDALLGGLLSISDMMRSATSIDDSNLSLEGVDGIAPILRFFWPSALIASVDSRPVENGDRPLTTGDSMRVIFLRNFLDYSSQQLSANSLQEFEDDWGLSMFSAAKDCANDSDTELDCWRLLTSSTLFSRAPGLMGVQLKYPP